MHLHETMKHRIDLMSRKILAHVTQDAGCDVEAVAAAVGCTVEVAEDRIRKLVEDGVIRGFRAQVDLSAVGGHYEALVVGVPGHETDPAALRRIAGQPDVGRVFTMAAQASVAFHLYGTDADELARRAAQLAGEAGFEAHRCTMIVSSLEGTPETPLLVA